MGSSGAGKTYSALRLATGIQRVTGGDIYVIDTESRRALHYADQFTFKHVEFKAPFGSLDFLAAMRFAVKEGARVIVVDSMTLEHDGEDGYLDFHGKEVERMAGSDYAKRERVKMAAWIRPSAHRRQMINGMLQLNANFVFCFRAKEKTKPKQGGGIEELGFMPIAGEEFLFEQTVNMLLPPKSNGVPQWRSDYVGEKLMMKLPKQFEQLFAEARPLDEAHGQALAEWARGGGKNVGGRKPGPQERPAKPADGKAMTPEQWATDAIAEIGTLPHIDAINAWITKNQKKWDALKARDAHLANEIHDALVDRTDRVNVLAAG